MSANNQLIIFKLKSSYYVLENPCFDNEIPEPKTDEQIEQAKKQAIYKDRTLSRTIKWANNYCAQNIVEYGVSVRI